MRILHVITDLVTGGAQMMLLRLISSSKVDCDTMVVSLSDEGTIGPRILELDIPLHALGLRRAAPKPFRALSIVRLVRRFRPQLIQGWMYHGNLMAGLAGVSSQDRVPVLWNIRQSLYDVATERRLTAAAIRLGAFLSRQPTAIIYNSESAARQHEAIGYEVGKRVVIPNGFDCQMFRPDAEARRQVRIQLQIDQDAILVGLIARFHPVKNHASFLQAAGLIVRAHPTVYFLLVGSSVTKEQPDLIELLREQQIQDRVFLLGERSDIPRLTAALDIACSASSSEAFSQAIGEAMASGVPCVVTDVGESRALVDDTGLSVPPRDPQALAQAIGRLIAVGAEQRRHLGAAARKRIENKFSLSSIVRRYTDLYEEHLGRGCNSRK